jgi:hypothetical protein
MKENQEVLFGDYTFLWRIASLQSALVISSANPVGIWRTEDGADFEMVPPGMYYDCCGSEGKALVTMKERIKLAEKDLEKHFKLHKICSDNFLDMDGAIVADDRSEFSSSCTMVYENVKEYLGLVKEHHQKLGNDGFLFYPFCVPGHYFHILNYERITPYSFNKRKTYGGASEDLDNIQKEIIDFRIRDHELPYLHLPLNDQDGAGLFNFNFKIHLRTNKNLLEKAGLDLSLPSKDETG